MYTGMRIGVVYSNKIFLDQWFNDFFERVDESAIYKVSKAKSGVTVCLKDGTIVRSVLLHDNCPRGLALDKVYVDPTIDIDSDAFKSIIMPMIKIPNIQVEKEYV